MHACYARPCLSRYTHLLSLGFASFTLGCSGGAKFVVLALIATNSLRTNHSFHSKKDKLPRDTHRDFSACLCQFLALQLASSQALVVVEIGLRRIERRIGLIARE
jgi:hypothetical protein